ncbi:MAG: hypothetical protein IMW91_06185 [Firmicutes bacterium]|nr:hypothetical protein [Bacillota bacterium]
MRSLWKKLAASLGAVLIASGVAGASFAPDLLYRLGQWSIRAATPSGLATEKVLNTPHFTIRYTTADAAMASLVGQTAERAYAAVRAATGFAPKTRIPITIYPSTQALSASFGWGDARPSLGVYWMGEIRLLSPQAYWGDRSDLAEIYWSQGPMVHEYTHLWIDETLRGHFPRWYTEGVAQVMEARITGYVWTQSDATLSSPGQYRMEALNDDFDALPNTALAYREAYAAAAYLMADPKRFAALQEQLRQGASMQQALTKVWGFQSLDAFDAAWRQYAQQHGIT